MRTCVVLNERSSKTRRHAARVPAMLASRGIAVDDFRIVADERALRKTVKGFVKSGAARVIVGGGDGSMTTAVDVLAHRDVVLGVLPLGTGNSFALTLGIADGLERSIDVIAAGRVARVDLGIVDGTHFANFATIGLPARVADDTSHALKAAIGPAAYVAAAFGPFFSARSFRARVRSESGSSKFWTQHIIIANGRFFGRTALLPDASIVDERLAFFTTTGVSRLAVARTYASFALSLQTRLPDAIVFSAETIAIKTSPKQPVNIDGNALGHTPVTFGIARRALRVYVPADFDGGR